MVHLAKFAGLPWDCVITAENARRYKPHADVYRTALTLLGLDAPEARFNLGKALERLGRRNEAIEEYRRLPDFEPARNALRALGAS
jgi:2-haloacid dehalogenase